MLNSRYITFCLMLMIPLAPLLESHTPPPSTSSFIEVNATFQSPVGWKIASEQTLSPNVKALVIGSSSSQFPPSINLATETYLGSLKQYLEIVKAIGEKQGGIWKDLGPFTTKAGKGRLTQLDTKTKWGDIRLMHLILLKNGEIYILTAAALKSEFASYYKEIFDAFSSFQIAFKQ